jgi:hypothetical protein
MLQGLVLIDPLSSGCWEKNEKKRKEKKREAARGFYFPINCVSFLSAFKIIHLVFTLCLGKTFFF